MARFLSHTLAARHAAERLVTDFAANRPARTEQLFRGDDKMQMREASRQSGTTRHSFKLQRSDWQKVDAGRYRDFKASRRL
jgi:hypothetical protein